MVQLLNNEPIETVDHFVLGTSVKHAAIVSQVEEDLLWESEVIGDHDSLALLRVVFIMLAKPFAFCVLMKAGQNVVDRGWRVWLPIFTVCFDDKVR